MTDRGIDRALDLRTLLKKKSYFLLGPRQTGKTFAIREQLKGVRVYNLLLKETFQKLSFNPALIREELGETDRYVVIDEIQRLPELLDEVHYLIEERGIRFLLTGSSARKLRRQGPNLLGGRARLKYFHPFVLRELGERFDLARVVNYGLLPSVYLSDEPEADLDAYLGLYLQQEIAAEGLARSLPAFSRFLEVASLCNAEQIDFTAVSNDAQVARTTVHEYFQVLYDTLVGHALPAWRETVKRKPVATPKFYLFDWGVARKLQGLERVKVASPVFGKAFESYLHHELRTYCDYHDLKELHYWRTSTGDEVDFILNGEVAVEVKGKPLISPKELKPLVRLKEEKLLKKYFVVYTGTEIRKPETDRGITIMPYQQFLTALWDGDVV